MKVAAGHAHRVPDPADERGAEIQLRWEGLDAHAEPGNRTLHRAISEQLDVVSPRPQGERSSNERLEVPAGSSGRDDDDPTHAADNSRCRSAYRP